MIDIEIEYGSIYQKKPIVTEHSWRELKNIIFLNLFFRKVAELIYCVD